jgi:hypothetical protein
MPDGRHADPDARPPAAVGRPASPCVRPGRPDLPLWWTPQRHSVTAFVTDQRLAASLLIALGLPPEPATFAPARDPTQAELDWDEPA